MPFPRLHGLQLVTRFSSSSEPPFSRGSTWSTSNSDSSAVVPQYLQRKSSRLRISKRFFGVILMAASPAHPLPAPGATHAASCSLAILPREALLFAFFLREFSSLNAPRSQTPQLVPRF